MATKRTKKAVKKKAARPVPRMELSIRHNDWGTRPAFYEATDQVFDSSNRLIREFRVCPHFHRTVLGAERCAKQARAAMRNAVIIPYKA